MSNSPVTDLTEQEYRALIDAGERALRSQEHLDLSSAPRRRLEREASDFIDTHDLFDNISLATCGAILEWTNADDSTLTRHRLRTNLREQLETAAREAVVADIVSSTRTVKYTVES